MDIGDIFDNGDNSDVGVDNVDEDSTNDDDDDDVDACSVDDNREESDKEVDESFLDHLITDPDETISIREDPILLESSNKSLAFVSWLCLFLTLWQYYFNITDLALETVLKFVKQFFLIFENQFNLSTTIDICMPSSLYMLHKLTNRGKDKFKKYVVCTKCFKLYDFQSCYTQI